MKTFSIYMDEAAFDFEGEQSWEVEWRIESLLEESGKLEDDALVAGLDLIDLINLRDALQHEIDKYALVTLEREMNAG